jgi:hypothetical protein
MGFCGLIAENYEKYYTKMVAMSGSINMRFPFLFQKST